MGGWQESWGQPYVVVGSGLCQCCECQTGGGRSPVQPTPPPPPTWQNGSERPFMSQACRLRARMTSMVSEPLRLIGGLSDKDDPRGVLVADSEPGLGPAAAISDACSAPIQVGERKVWGFSFAACQQHAAAQRAAHFLSPFSFPLPPPLNLCATRTPGTYAHRPAILPNGRLPRPVLC